MSNLLRKLSIRKLKNKVLWYQCCKKMKNIGVNSSVGENFEFYNSSSISIGDNFICGKDCKILTYETYKEKPTGMRPQIVIGNNGSITSRCFFSCINEIIIGNGVLMGTNVFITDNFHGKNDSIEELMIPPSKRDLYSRGAVKIGDNVWIGSNVCVMPNVEIGTGAIIGANAVVTCSIPPYCIAVGVPAKIIRRIDNSSEDNDKSIIKD